MAERPPTDRQRDMLLALASGAMLISGRHGRTIPQLERHGWIAPEKPGEQNGYRITAAGLRALAARVERDGLPEIRMRREARPEPPIVVRLRQQRDDARAQLATTARDLSRLRVITRRATSALAEASDV